MQAYVEEIVAMVRAMDGDALLAPQTMEKIVVAVLKAVDEREGHGRRSAAERRVTGGVREEMEQEARIGAA